MTKPMSKNGWDSRFYKGAEVASDLEAVLSSLIEHHYDLRSNRFDYETCKTSGDYNKIQLLARSLGDFDPGALTSLAARKAFWLNLYNILILHVVMSGDQIQSIMEKQDFFQGFRYQLKPHAFSLDEIEHGILRANTPSFRKLRKPLRRRHPAYLHIMNPLDPRVHMAFHCASLSSAPLRVFNPESIEKELESASSDFLSRHVSLLENQLSLPRCFYWYKKDFGQKFGLLNFIEKHHPDPQIKQQIGHQGNRIKIHFTEFDWTLNSMEK
ncbi:MAG: DUF547 domain-containing protein [Endozoicomonas sp.]|uniref:DUF547 domain-containing protein n=1 Tax=Endozoicomonas sp. TaxID=1892382 RepID=UPI003D9B73B5